MDDFCLLNKNFIFKLKFIGKHEKDESENIGNAIKKFNFYNKSLLLSTYLKTNKKNTIFDIGTDKKNKKVEHIFTKEHIYNFYKNFF